MAISFCLALTLILGLLAPCGALLQTSAATTLYGDNLEQVTEPVIGESYYLGADVDGTMKYFTTGTVTNTAPYSLVTTERIAVAVQVTLESSTLTSENFEGGFQFIYDNNGTVNRVYCMDVLKDATTAGQTGVMDTGVQSGTAYKNRHSFFVDDLDGVKILRKYGNENILVVKYNETTETYRMLGVPVEELANEGVYPVMLLQEHSHSFGDAAIDTDNNTASRTCASCGYVETVYGNKLVKAEKIVVGNEYYLAANVGDAMQYVRHGSVTETVPYSLATTNNVNHSWLFPMTFAAPVEGNTGFQITYTNPSGTNVGIYCMDVGADESVDTGVNAAPALDTHTFVEDTVNGVSVLRCLGNDYVLAFKQMEQTVSGVTSTGWRMLGVSEEELANEGVYPVVVMEAHEHDAGSSIAAISDAGHSTACWCGAATAEIAHTYGDVTTDATNNTHSRSCTVCGYTNVAYGQAYEQVNYPTIGNSYYLAANVAGGLKYFTTGTVTTTAPYSLVTTERVNVAVPVTLESSTETSENFEGGFQFTYDNGGTLTRIYCMDVLKDATTAGQTGIMDTGANTGTAYKNRHSFWIDEVDGVKVLRKYGNNNILVVKLNETTNTYRMLGVPEAELANEGVYPVMLATAHTHVYGEEVYGDATGHWNLCDCGSKSTVEEHTVENWTVITPPSATEPGSKSGVCTLCGETATVETPVTVISWNIVLGDNIGVNFVLALTEGDTVAVTVDGEEVPATLTDNGNGTYTVFIKLAAAQMTDEIVISVNGYAVEKTYSVRAYADEILAGDYTSYTKALVQNMLVYGGAAQTYFGHNTENLADEGIEVTAAEPAAAPELVVLNELANIKYYGASLLHKEKTAVRFYFTADSVEGLTFQVDGNIYEPVSKDGLYYIEVAGINPQDLDDVLNVVVTDGTSSLAVQYSPLIYIARMYSKAGTSTALVQAMYGYHLAAKAYLANLNLADDFALQSQSESVLYEGVTLYEKTYVAAGYGEVEAYVIAIDAAANVELKVSAGAWDETNNGDNPAEAMTVANHFRSVKNAGNNVLAMINGGFFDLNNTGSNLPYGMQVVDGVVKQAPSTDNSYSDNWFGMTKEGKYVISNAAGYADYEGNVQQAVGGGKLLIVDGVPVDLTSERAYRTAVGVNADGDLVMVAVADATYSDVCHIFVDMGLDIVTVLNLDGGGSTAMYVPGAYYPKALILGDDGFFPREVADAVAIVVKQ